MSIIPYKSTDSYLNEYYKSVQDVHNILSKARTSIDNAAGSDFVTGVSLIEEIDLDGLIKKVEAEYNKMTAIHHIVTVRKQKAEVSSEESQFKRWTFRVIGIIATGGTIAFTFLQIFTATGAFDLSIYIGTAIVFVLAILAELKDRKRKKQLKKLAPLTFDEMKDTHRLLCALKSWKKINDQNNPSDYAVKICLEKINLVSFEVINRFCDRDLLVCNMLEKLPEGHSYRQLLADAFVHHNSSGDIEVQLDHSNLSEDGIDPSEGHCVIEMRQATDSTQVPSHMMLSKEGSKKLIEQTKVPFQKLFYNNMAATMPGEIRC